ncbi:membrane-bound oxidoreductase domain protein [Mycobacterium xenopi 4042]|uniref:Membrane-bound oxidoreductase domain protein n=1 Tax=Mycobacterium xenopi 4042 TaxID=1299334 RepID=X8C823_MYCXE|nr:membrane-bound oxidoreductase domain protein [Mycobacterium xenopi 4042]
MAVVELPWQAKSPGKQSITVRATDNTGATQTADQVDTVPDGATGWHTVDFTVAET